MSILTERTFDEIEIRDTNSHTGNTVFNGEFTIKTIIIENGLNQLVSFQCQASMHADFSNPFNVGTAWDVTANTNTYQSCDTYFPYWRLTAICGTAPTTGDMTVHVLGIPT